MNIVPKLQLNKHPEVADNMSLVTASNVRLSNDGGCICNEESIVENTVIKEYLSSQYSGEDSFRIIAIIPCNTELAIITSTADASGKNIPARIYRYKEKAFGQEESIELAYSKLVYHGGKIKGTFTYNVEGSLILAIAESGVDGLEIPLRVVNLGNSEDDGIPSDKELEDSSLFVSPEVRIPSTVGVEYVAGSAYKGWYYLFVRFKINSVDYTQWYSFGQPVYVDKLEQQKIIKYCFRQEYDVTGVRKNYDYDDMMTANGNKFVESPPDGYTKVNTPLTSIRGVDDARKKLVAPGYPTDGCCVGATDWFSNSKDVCDVTFKARIVFDPVDGAFDYYQIGILCVSKTFSKTFRTDDLKLGKSSNQWTEYYTFDTGNVIDSNLGNSTGTSTDPDTSVNSFISDYYNPVNVGNITNYGNRLYIANYSELASNNKKLEAFVQSKEGDIGMANVPKLHPVYTQVKFNLYVHDGTITDMTPASSNPSENNEADVDVCTYGSVRQYEIKPGYKSDVEPYGVSGKEFFNLDDNWTRIKMKGNALMVTGTTWQNADYELDSHIHSLYIVPNSGFYSADGSGKLLHYGMTYPSGVMFVLVNGNTQVHIFEKEFELTIRPGSANEVVMKINPMFMTMNYGSVYSDPSTSFEQRLNQRFFLQGEIYNFFIHYVDAYGHATNGYRISNENKWYDKENQGIEYVPLPFTASVAGMPFDDDLCIAAMPIDSNVQDGDGLLNTSGLQFFRTMEKGNSYGTYYLTQKLSVSQGLIDAFKESYNSFSSDIRYSNMKWFQITSCFSSVDVVSQDGNDAFYPFINEQGDRLFRMPIRYNDYRINRTGNDDFFVGGYMIDVTDVKIPDGYVGWFLSYEKFEPFGRVTGMLTRSDFKSQATVYDGVCIRWSDKFESEHQMIFTNGGNTQLSSYMYFYSGLFDAMDQIKLDYNILRIEGENLWDIYDCNPFSQIQRGAGYEYCYDYNKPQVKEPGADRPFRMFAPPRYKLAPADSAKDGRQGLGTALQMDDAYGLFPVPNPKTEDWTEQEDPEHPVYPTYIKLYKATLLNVTRAVYMNKEKTLIRCTNVIYGRNSAQGQNIFPNGCVTYDGCLIYNDNRVILNTANNKVYRLESNIPYYPMDEKDTPENDMNFPVLMLNRPFAAYVQTLCYSDRFFESKCFNNEPAGVIYYVNQNEDPVKLDRGSANNAFRAGCFVEPKDSIDLFKNRQESIDVLAPKTYSNYKKEIVSEEHFDGTIRRSNVYQDETRENAWRQFPMEAYKNISENKGKITNLVGLGSSFFVHTEHSLFMLDTNNLLQANNADIQLTQPDVFEVNYKEVLTSTLGYGGLQDDLAYITGQFGYTWYNDDFHRFYNLDGRSLKPIDTGIVQWLDVYKPYNVRFVNDIKNSRILVRFDYRQKGTEKSGVLSYNYMTNSFISTHDYSFERGYNTKTGIYLKCNPDYSTGCALHSFVTDSSSYGKYDNLKDHMNVPTVRPSSIGIIVNSQYELIKFLDFIVYKLNKCKNPKDADSDYLYSPVEELISPYSADWLRVYNNVTDTGKLDILVDEETRKNLFCNYQKPYWELGNWNFSYLRNNISAYDEYGKAYGMSRMYGNYFVVEFTFSNKDEKKVEFESLGCKFSSNYGG